RLQAVGDSGNRLLPADSLEASFSLPADAPHRIKQPIGMVGALGVARHLGTEHPGSRRMAARPGHLDGDSISDMDVERACVGAVMRTCALDDGHGGIRRFDHCAYPVSRMRSMNRSHCASCSRATNSFGPCACAISPGPQMTLGTPIFWNNPA